MGKSKKSEYEIDGEVIERYKVSKVNQDRIKAISEYDLAFVTDNLNEDLIKTGRTYSCEQVYPLRERFGVVDKRLAARLEQEFKRFCIITLIKVDVPHAPAGAVDMYWHFFILHTEHYMKFSEKAWGDFKGDPKFRQHYPSNDNNRKGMLNAYKATRDLYVDIYGEPKPYKLKAIKGVAEALTPRAIWTVGSDTSGDSFSGTIEGAYYVE